MASNGYGWPVTRDASRSRRSLSAIATLSIAAASLAGCSWMSPRQTMETYAPADGIEADLGPVKVTNLVIVSDKEGSEGTLVGSVANSSATEQTITIGADGSEGAAQKIPANGMLNLQQAGAKLPSVPAAPGGMAEVTLKSPDSGSVNVSVPVMPREGIYATVTPGAGSETASATETPLPTDTAAASESASATPTSSETSGTVAPAPAGESDTVAPSPSATS